MISALGNLPQNLGGGLGAVGIGRKPRKGPASQGYTGGPYQSGNSLSQSGNSLSQSHGSSAFGSPAINAVSSLARSGANAFGAAASGVATPFAVGGFLAAPVAVGLGNFIEAFGGASNSTAVDFNTGDIRQFVNGHRLPTRRGNPADLQLQFVHSRANQLQQPQRRSALSDVGGNQTRMSQTQALHGGLQHLARVMRGQGASDDQISAALARLAQQLGIPVPALQPEQPFVPQRVF